LDRRKQRLSFRPSSQASPARLAAVPAQYRVTRVQTFIVGPDGVVYQKERGPETLKAFESTDRRNPE